MISVIFTRRDSIYKHLNQDCWDKTRNAHKWPGGNAIIAHPPCRAWGDYSWKSNHTPEEKQLAIWAIHKIRLWGGILEHPRKSKIRQYLPEPGKIDKWGGYTIYIQQKWFGHPAEKETLLYIVGIKQQELPLIPITFDTTTNTIQNMSIRQREHTPIKLAQWLIYIANQIENNKNTTK